MIVYFRRYKHNQCMPEKYEEIYTGANLWTILAYSHTWVKLSISQPCWMDREAYEEASKINSHSQELCKLF